jgi:cytochrome c
MSPLRGPVIAGLSLLIAACSSGSPPSGTNATSEAPEAPPPPANSTDTMTGATLAQHSGDPAAGQRAFAVCQACHAIEPGAVRIGPTLHGVVGRRAAALPGFSYSQALRDSGIVWTPEKLFQFLENPARVVPRSRMAFAGVGDPQRRADLIAYLGTLHD